MNTREKLIDLLCQAHNKATDASAFECATYAQMLEVEADNLIANGVTIPVRCKDCKGWCTEEIAKRYGVDRYCTATMMPTNADDFCSYGERRTDEQIGN